MSGRATHTDVIPEHTARNKKKTERDFIRIFTNEVKGLIKRYRWVDRNGLFCRTLG